jgi:enterochelin esterase-like enzyme
MFEFCEYCLDSRSLEEPRRLTVALPRNPRVNPPIPLIFCADGQAVAFLSVAVGAAIDAQQIPPVGLIGVHQSSIYRAEEYLYGIDEQRFCSHERFFTEEVIAWTKSQFGVGADRDLRGVFGFSNGGAFAIHMALHHGDKFAVAIAFSVPRSPKRATIADFKQSEIGSCYLAAGKRERGFKRETRAIANALQRSGKKCVYHERDAGHEARFWAAELSMAIAWSFPEMVRHHIPLPNECE